jgi:non-homologous end joining protein Ku
MLKKKQAGISVPKGQPAVPAPNVVNLMDALKRSIAGGEEVISQE